MWYRRAAAFFVVTSVLAGGGEVARRNYDGADPSVNAGADDSATVDVAYTLSGTCTDDGYPISGGGLVCTWSEVSCAGTPTFVDANDPDTDVTVDTDGACTLKLCGDDDGAGTGEAAVCDEVTLTVAAAGGDPWPSLTEDLGYHHPSCETVCESATWESDIESTSCGISGGAPTAGATYDCCSHSGHIDLQGDNTTFRCAKWDTGTTAIGMGCANGSGCAGTFLDRVSGRGNEGLGSSAQILIRMTSQRGGPFETLRVDKSEFGGSQTQFYCGSAVDGSSVAEPTVGQGEFAVVVTYTRWTDIEHNETADSHDEHVFISEGCNGTYFENNLLDCAFSVTNDGCNSSPIQGQTGSTGAGNNWFVENRIVHDGTGTMHNWDRASGSAETACADPVYYIDNVFVYPGTDPSEEVSLFDFGSGGTCPGSCGIKQCPSFANRPSGLSQCTGNVFEGPPNDGQGAICTGTGF